MADNRNSNEDKKMSINDDYIELLSIIKEKDEYEDIYSNSSRVTDDDYEDVFSDSSFEDIYSDSKFEKTENDPDGIYISKRNNQYKNFVSKSPTEEIVETDDEVLVQQNELEASEDEVSDFEQRRGRKNVPKKKRKRKGSRFLALLLAVILGFGGFLFVSANSVVGKLAKAEKIEHIENAELISNSNVRNILLIGSDKEKGGAARSDTIIIASVNKTTGRITICSLLRDTHLYIPGEGEAKVNSAYAWGGASLLVQTIEHNFGIKIDDYATVNFEMFTALVDGLGGIEVEVTENEADYINNRHNYGNEKKPDHVESGEKVYLNGYQALWYARIRKLDSDFMRTERQRKVLASIAAKMKAQLNPVGIFGLVNTAKDIAPYVETTLSTPDFFSLMFSLVTCLTKSGADMDKLLSSQQIPFDGTWWYSSQWDGSSISINLQENKEMLHKLLYEEN